MNRKDLMESFLFAILSSGNLSPMLLLLRKWIVDILLGGMIMAGAWNADLLEYGARMGAGQLRIILNARPVRSYLADPDIPDSLKQKVLLIQEIKRFTVDSMGLYPSPNYSTVYDQHGKPLLWVVTASERYELKPKLWKFPVVGKVSYKGFFRQEQAEWEARRLEQEGYETKIRTVNAWSTLGWFRDPIMTSMLEDKPGEIANVIIHELSHGTIYVKNDAEYSENLANFIGDEGSYWFLRSKYGERSKEYREFFYGNEDYRKFAHHFVTGAHRLDSLYTSAEFRAMETGGKNLRKNGLIRDIMNDLDTIRFYEKHPLIGKLKEGELPNNAFFIVFLQYSNQQDLFMDEFRREGKGDLRQYIGYLREKFPR